VVCQFSNVGQLVGQAGDSAVIWNNGRTVDFGTKSGNPGSKAEAIIHCKLSSGVSETACPKLIVQSGARPRPILECAPRHLLPRAPKYLPATP
jgi:hypothetical protein